MLRSNRKDQGFTVVELIVVMSVMTIMTSVSLYYLYSNQRLYKPDEQAALMIDMFQEARQRALTQKSTMRVELDLTDNIARLINERDALTVDDDDILRTFPLRAKEDVNIEIRPSNVTLSPTEPSPVPSIVFVPMSIYPGSLNHKVATIRFKKDGTITNAGNTPIGGGSTISGVTIFVWQPDKKELDDSTITRAITILGATGAIRLWNHHPGVTGAAQWKDSRRFQ